MKWIKAGVRTRDEIYTLDPICPSFISQFSLYIYIYIFSLPRFMLKHMDFASLGS